MATDFPDYYEEKIIITPLSVIASLHEAAAGVFGLSVAAWPVANRAFFVPFTLAEALTFKRMFILSDTVAANFDVGIYDADGKRLVSTGSLVKGITAQCVVANIADTLLAAGRYYLALALDNNTGTVGCWAPLGGWNTMCGVREMAAAFPLPATATFAETNTRGFVPVIGLTLQAA